MLLSVGDILNTMSANRSTNERTAIPYLASLTCCRISVTIAPTIIVNKPISAHKSYCVNKPTENNTSAKAVAYIKAGLYPDFSKVSFVLPENLAMCCQSKNDCYGNFDDLFHKFSCYVSATILALHNTKVVS